MTSMPSARSSSGGPDPAPQQHRRRPVGAGRQHDRLGLDHAGPIGGVHDDPARPPALDHDPVGERPRQHRQPGAGTGRVEVGERRAPPRPSAPVHRQQPRAADGVGGVEVIQHGLAEPGPGVERGSRERSDLVRCESARRNRLLGAHQQRLHRRPAPAGVTRRDRPPVVVGRRAAHDEAAVVRRAAADDTAGDVDAVAPVVRRRAVGCVEQVGGPPTCVVRAVVRAGLDQADHAVAALREARGEDAPRRARPNHADVGARQDGEAIHLRKRTDRLAPKVTAEGGGHVAMEGR